MRRFATLTVILTAVALLFGGCLSPPGNSGKGGARAAVWRISPEEGLAHPHCPKCDEVVSRRSSNCVNCGLECRIVQKTVDCPDCDASGECSHCNTEGTCIPCAGSGKCGICDGKGEYEGAECPECEGARYCIDCAGSKVGRDCEYCEDTHDCANCGGDGEIELR